MTVNARTFSHGSLDSSNYTDFHGSAVRTTEIKLKQSSFISDPHECDKKLKKQRIETTFKCFANVLGSS